MRFFILVISLFFLSISTYSQSYNSLKDDQQIIDSLKVIFNTSKSDSIKCIASFKLANVYVRDNQIKLYNFYKQKANQLIKNNNYLNDISFYYNANSFLLERDPKGYKKALEVANSKLDKYSSKEIYAIRALIHRNLAVSFQMEGNDKEAFSVLTRAISLAEKAGDNEMLGIIYNSIGILFLNNKNFVKSEYYLSKSIKQIEQKVLTTTSYSESLVETYILYAEILIELDEFDKALLSLKKAENKLKKHPNSNLNGYYYSTRGYFEHHSLNFKEALLNFDKGLKFAKLTNDFPTITRLNLMKFSSLKQLKEYNKAKILLIETLDNDYIHIQDIKDYSKELSWIYKQLNDYPNALKFSDQYIKLNDSLNAISNKKEIEGLETKFKSKENENKIKQLKIQNDKAQLLVQNNRMSYITFASISVALLLLLVFILSILKNKNKLAKAIELKNIQQITLLRKQKEVEVMQAMITGEEAERKRIARDLHDGIGSRLTALKMQLHNKSQFENNSILIDEFSNSLSISIIELRQIAFNLMPETLLKLGLELALKDLCHSLCSANIAISFQANEISPIIKSNDQVTIFRIVQELINNALKHSSCTEIIVDCSQNNNLFLITVEDNGLGFNSTNLDEYSGLGIKNIKNRIELLSGKLEVKSTINKGTIFNIELILN